MLEDKPRRGRPPKLGLKHTIRVTDGKPERLIDRDAAIKLVAGMPDAMWTYKRLAEYIDKSKDEAMELMNDLVHYGLMIYRYKANKKVPVFERCPYVPEKW